MSSNTNSQPSPSPEARPSSKMDGVKAEPETQDEQQQQLPPDFYTLVLTGVNFVTFLLSLFLVDRRYTMLRSRDHAGKRSRLPAWLHSLLYCPQPYAERSGGLGGGSAQQQDTFYHSKQKQLWRMEAAEAFQLRSTVLVFLAVAAAAVTMGTGYLASRVYQHLRFA